MNPDDRRLYQFDDFRLDPLKRQLTRGGEVVPLHSKALDILLVLVQSGGRDVTKDELLEQVWPGQILEESNLPVNISAIRRALGEKVNDPRYLVTIPGRGYRFIARVQELAEALVIESQTISQITVEEETDDRESAAVNSPSLPASDRLLLNDAKSSLLVPPSQPAASFFKRPVVIALATIGLVAVVVASVLVARTIKRNRLAVNRFHQIKLRQLTNDGGVIVAALSPDGRFFAMVHTDRTGGKARLLLAQTSGELPVELRAPERVVYRQVEFSADGNNLYYVMTNQGVNTLYRLPVLGGVPVKLRESVGASFSLSPDNQHIAFLRANTANRTRSIVISSLDGSNERAALTMPAERSLNAISSWSPDGSLIALSAHPENNLTDVGIFLLEVGSGKLTPFSRSLWRETWSMAWLKDGSGLVLIARAKPGDNREISVVEYPSGEARRISNDVNDYNPILSVTADSNQILTTQYQQNGSVWVAPSDDLLRPRQLTFAASSRQDGVWGVDWTPDGKIVYVARTGNTRGIWIMDADGKNSKALTPPGTMDAANPHVTRDGRFVLFELSRDKTTEIWRVGPDGTGLKQLTTCGNNTRPESTADSKWVVFRSDCDPVGALWRISIDGGEMTRLTDRGGSWPAISPDGKWIACKYWGETAIKLAVYPIEGGTPAKIFDLPDRANANLFVKWAPEGNALFYRDEGEGLWRQSLDGGEPQKVALANEKIGFYAWSRDGQQLVFVRGAEIRDAVLITAAP